MSFSDERDYAEEQWQRDEAEREGLAELDAERAEAKPNAELAYQVLDYIDAHPEQWEQGVYIGKMDCGTVACFAGWAIMLGRPESVLEFMPSGRKVARGEVLQEAGSIVDDDGRLTSARVMAEKLLGASSWLNEHEDDEEDLFDQNNTREDLGRLVEQIFGPRPVDEFLCGEENCSCGDDVPPNAGSAS